jgi:hypothetical protein
LSSPDPHEALFELAVALKKEGMGQVALYHLFVEYQNRTDPDGVRNDAVLDTLDLIWSGAWAKGRALFDRELTSEDVDRPGKD